MRNIPVFTGEDLERNDLAGNTGREACWPMVQWVQPGKTWEFLAECARFCRMAGARRVLSSLPSAGAPAAPPQVRLLRMACLRSMPETDAALWPFCRKRRRISAIYNEGHVRVPAACPCTRVCPGFLDQGADILSTGMERFWGIGQVNGDTLLSLVSCRRGGAGEMWRRALISVMQGETVELQVAESNLRARAFV